MFTNYPTTNNGRSQLATWISTSWTTITLKTGYWWLFPATWPFLVTLEKIDSNWAVTKREIPKIQSRSWDVLTVASWGRAFGTCPISDTATTQTNTAQSFDADDYCSIYFTTEDLEEIKWELERLETDKLNIDDLRTWMSWTWKTHYIDWSWNEQPLSLDVAWKVLYSNWTSSAPSRDYPSVNIDLLTEKTTLANDDYTIIYDTTWLSNKKHLAQASVNNKWMVQMATDLEASAWTDESKYLNSKQIKDNYWPQPEVNLALWDISGSAYFGFTAAGIWSTLWRLFTYNWNTSAVCWFKVIWNFTAISSIVLHFLSYSITPQTANVYLYTEIRRRRLDTIVQTDQDLWRAYSYSAESYKWRDITLNSAAFNWITLLEWDFVMIWIWRNWLHASDTLDSNIELCWVSIVLS